MSVTAIIAARMGSTRFPGKVLAQLGDGPVLQWVLQAACAAQTVDDVCVATSTEPADDAIEALCKGEDYECFRGPEHDVLKRFADCARHCQLVDNDVVIRLTGDCPFLDSRIIDEVVTLQRRSGVAYAQNVSPPSYPDGLDVEVFTAAALYAAEREATHPLDRDCLTQYIERHRLRWPSATLTCPVPGLHQERWVLDDEADYRFCQEVVRRLATEPNLINILAVLDAEPELRKINSNLKRNQRFYASLVSK